VNDIPGGEILVYEAPDGRARVEVRLDRETVWLTQRQMADLFTTSADNIGLHLKNIFLDKELDEVATTEDFSVVQLEGKRNVHREVKHYNLDAIISVGYRVSSPRAVRFRQWATTTLRDHLIRTAAAGEALTSDQGRGLVDIIARYTQTFLLLQRYDEGLLTEPRGIPGGRLLQVAEVRDAIARLKADLVARGEAHDLFGREREDGLAALLGNLDQTVFGEPAYPTIESKAAHLLYFVIKNHPFTDGNKRIGSFLFVEFLHRNGQLTRQGAPIINDVGLAALALLVAESAPKDKEVMIRLVMTMLAKPAS
jgi:prophage maintenance system killer protein